MLYILPILQLLSILYGETFDLKNKHLFMFLKVVLVHWGLQTEEGHLWIKIN